MKVRNKILILVCCLVLITGAYFTYRITAQIKKAGTIEYINEWNTKEDVKYLVFGNAALAKISENYTKKEFNILLADCTIDAKYNCTYKESFEPKQIDLYYNEDTLVVSYWYNCSNALGLPCKELAQYKILNKRVIK